MAWKPLLMSALLGLLFMVPAGAESSPPDFAGLGKLPVLHNGRIKPLDTIARNSLLRIRGKQTLQAAGRRMPAIEWLLEVMAGTGKADSFAIFVINDPDVLGLIGKKQSKNRYFSFQDIAPAASEILRQAERASGIPPQQRDRFTRAVYDLGQRLNLYQQLQNTLWGRLVADPDADLKAFKAVVEKDLTKVMAMLGGGSADDAAARRFADYLDRYRFLSGSAYFRAVPPAPGRPVEEWTNIGEALLQGLRGDAVRPEVELYAGLVTAYRRGDIAAFNQRVAELQRQLTARAPRAAGRAKHESIFNRLQPFYWGMILYLIVFLTVCMSWLFKPRLLRRAAFTLLAAALAVQTLGLLSRMILQGRPPVTNLYSSAVVVGWVGVLLSLVLERMHRRGIACAVGSLAGFCTLLIAHNLAMSGDTMEMMQAVLDSNFWLATHVITIIIGYGATYLAGGFAVVFILLKFIGRLSRENSRSLAQMVYGTVCFALLFTYIGTVLGGIWADQSWGRFWGWDPKENGALLMLLWQSVILHARAALFIRERGLMVMAVFGNIVTSLSWFGVNMLGVGLHSYGFMDKAFFWLALFVVSQLLVMSLAFVPRLEIRLRKSAAH